VGAAVRFKIWRLNFESYVIVFNGGGGIGVRSQKTAKKQVTVGVGFPQHITGGRLPRKEGMESRGG
jgi:hypothetical protein